MADFATANAVLKSVRSFLGSADGVIKVETVLGEKGPEVRVTVRKDRMKHFRLLLPTEKRGVPIKVMLPK